MHYHALRYLESWDRSNVESQVDELLGQLSRPAAEAEALLYLPGDETSLELTRRKVVRFV